MARHGALLIPLMALLVAAGHAAAQRPCAASATCPANFEGKQTGRTTTCLACKPGHYKALGAGCCSDTPCTNGVISAAGACSFCPANSLLTPGVKGSSCVCNPGYQAASAVPAGTTTGVLAVGCSACTPGTFNAEKTISATACKPCPTGTFSSDAAATACSSCPAHAAPNSSGTGCDCNAGYYKDGASCVACPAGTASSTAGGVGIDSCTACIDNTYSAAEASQSCSTCESPKSAANGDHTGCVCPAGQQEDPDDSTQCVPCDAGTANNAIGGTCLPCSSDTYSAQGAQECLTCVSPKVVNGDNSICGCPAGQQEDPNNSAQCVTCDAGTANNAIGGTCLPCIDNTYSSAEASQTCSTCLAPKSAANGDHTGCVCPAGQQEDPDDSTNCIDA